MIKITSYLVFIVASATIVARSHDYSERTDLAGSYASVQASISQLAENKDRRNLALHVPVECEFKPGDIHAYGVTVQAGQYIRVVVTQKGIDLVITLVGPDRRKITEVDSPNQLNGPEPASAVAESTGTYRLEIRAFDPRAAVGRYEIQLLELREPTALDREQIGAERILVEAQKLSGAKSKDALNQALEKYLEVLPMLRATGDRWKEAETLSVMGVVYLRLGELTQSLNSSTQALSLWRQIKDCFSFEARALNNIGAAYERLGQPEKAIDSYLQALSLNRQFGDRLQEAYILRNIGLFYVPIDFKKAAQNLESSLSVSRDIQEQPLEASVLSLLGDLYSHYGEPKEALQYQTAALQLQRKLGDHWEEGCTLQGLGRVYSTMGETQKALESFREGLSLSQVAGNRLQEASILVSIGSTYADAGEAQTAISYFEKALLIGKTNPDPWNKSVALTAAAHAHQDVGDLQKAFEYLNEAQSLNRLNGNKLAENRVLANIGAIDHLLGRRDKAILKLSKALEVQTALNDRLGQAYTLSEIGSIYSSENIVDRAITYFQKALSLQRAFGYKRYEAETLYRLGELELKRDRPHEAKSNLESALRIIEEIRTNSFNQDLRTSFSASVENYYELYVDVLMALHRESPNSGFDVLAFETTERARSRGLLEIIRESHADIRQGVDPALLARERTTQRQLNAKADRLTRLRQSSYAKAQEMEVTDQIDCLVNELQEIQAQIRAESPQYAALMQPQPFSLREIQNKLLDEYTVLVEYSLGEQHSYSFVLDSKTLTTYVLPGRATIEEAARHVYNLLISKADKLDPEALLRLSGMVLQPIATQLSGKRILIVTDGALQFIPFAVLPEPNSTANSNAQLPLILSHEVVSLPSASVMVTQREQPARAAASKRVVVFADPVFDISDTRVRNSFQHAGNVPIHGQLGSAPSALKQAEWDLGVTSFERLPKSRLEADYVTSKVRTGEYLKALDFSASWTLANSPEVSKYQIIHFATHSFLNNQHPELSGIVLSLVDQEGRPQDGFLRLNEIYNLKLNADLVVLSACRTAVGKDVKGEGLISLTRGFMYAGAPRIIASLWKVSDEATAELMKRLYENVLEREMRPAAALRAAQISLWKENQWRAPFTGAVLCSRVNGDDHKI